MRRSCLRTGPRSRRAILALAVAFGLAACAGQGDLVERDYPSHAFTARSGEARVELVHAAYLPRGVEFELRLRNASDRPLELVQDGILLAFQGLEYPLDGSGAATVGRDGSNRVDPLPDAITLEPDETKILHLPFRLGRPMSESGWIVLRGLRMEERFREPLWLEVPAVPSKLDIEPRTGPKRGTVVGR